MEQSSINQYSYISGMTKRRPTKRRPTVSAKWQSCEQ